MPNGDADIRDTVTQLRKLLADCEVLAESMEGTRDTLVSLIKQAKVEADQSVDD
jgi:hypothetical protein